MQRVHRKQSGHILVCNQTCQARIFPLALVIIAFFSLLKKSPQRYDEAAHINVAKSNSRAGEEDGKSEVDTLPNVENEIESVDGGASIVPLSSLLRWVGPFDNLMPEDFSQRRSHCTKTGLFSETAKNRTFTIVLHEASLTGAPLAMAELAGELLRCGSTVTAVVLNKKGGLVQELNRRGITVCGDKKEGSWVTASRSDLVVVGSAASSSWLASFLARYPSASSSVVWWLMENRKEYFTMAQPLLSSVSSLVFISSSQAQLWKEWSNSIGVQLASRVAIIGLSLGEDLAVLAGLVGGSSQSAVAWRARARREARQSMGLSEDDMLVSMLSSVNPGKGQLRLVHAALRLQKRQTACSGHGARWKRLRVLIGSMNGKSNKADYVKRIQQTVIAEKQTELFVWTNATVQVAPLYVASDVYIMNAQGIGETFGRVTVEAMAFGLPVLGTNVGGTAEIVVPNVTGLLHPVGSSGEGHLAENLHRLLCQREEAVRMGQSGRARVVERYLDAAMYLQLAGVFQEVLKNEGRHYDF